MNLYIIILRRTRSFFVFFFPLWQKQTPQFAHTAKKKDLVSERRDQNRIYVVVPPKSEKKKKREQNQGKKTEKKEGDVNFHPFSLSLSLLSTRF